GWTSYRRCRRPGPARSSARPCAASRTATTSRFRPPSTTRARWRRCARSSAVATDTHPGSGSRLDASYHRNRSLPDLRRSALLTAGPGTLSRNPLNKSRDRPTASTSRRSAPRRGSAERVVRSLPGRRAGRSGGEAEQQADHPVDQLEQDGAAEAEREKQEDEQGGHPEVPRLEVLPGPLPAEGAPGEEHQDPPPGQRRQRYQAEHGDRERLQAERQGEDLPGRAGDPALQQVRQPHVVEQDPRSAGSQEGGDAGRADGQRRGRAGEQRDDLPATLTPAERDFAADPPAGAGDGGGQRTERVEDPLRPAYLPERPAVAGRPGRRGLGDRMRRNGDQEAGEQPEEGDRVSQRAEHYAPVPRYRSTRQTLARRQ